MKKIIIFLDNLSSGGAQRRASNIAILLKERGYCVSVLIYGEYYFFKKGLNDNEIPVILVKSRNKLSRILKIRDYLNNKEIDVVISFLETPGFIAGISKIGGKRWKLITTESSAKTATFTSPKNRVYNVLNCLSDAKVCNSFNALHMWMRFYPKYSSRYQVIYNPVILKEVETAYNPPDLQNKIRIVVAASYQELKNPIRVIEAIHLLNESDKERLSFDWYGRIEVTKGDRKIYDIALNKMNQYGLNEIVRLNPETNDIYNIMKNSDVVALFSTVEGMPNVICEGMMMGKPVIMSNVSDYKTLVDKNGILCDPQSVESIRDAISRVINLKPEELKQMGIRSKEIASNLFSPYKVAEQWIDLIERI